jgi:glycosyltransferase involved in cell wall biosynthesis
MTSDHEGLPNALIEAQGLGLPAVSTLCPWGPDEIIEDGATGLLVPVGDVEAFADGILSILSDAPRRRSMGLAAAARSRRLFDCARLTRVFEGLFVRLAEPGALRRES